MSFSISSPCFENQGDIPEHFTPIGANVSPPLHWDDVPLGTKSLALILEDPDAPDPTAPQKPFVHWVVYNLPVSVNALPEGINHLPKGAKEGFNDLKQTGYSGPNPPFGRHRYVHRLFALDCLLGDLHEPSKKQLEKAMRGHVLEETDLIGTYARH